MKMIVISETRFDELLENARSNLQKERFKAVAERAHDDLGITMQDMERIFNYELCVFAQKLKDG